MSQRSLRGAGGLRLAGPMTPRDPAEPGRAATPLELFFDLVFIVAVATAVESLHASLARGEVASSVLGFFVAFFGLWWAWMNFTWFASAYDADDVVYRVSMFVAMTGALILAAGLPASFSQRDRWIAVLGYVVMRLVLVTQWIRVARSDAPRRITARRFAIGVTVCQVGWVAALALPPGWWLAVAAPARGNRRAPCAGLGRIRSSHPLASRAHRRAIRPFHHHRAWRIGHGGVIGHPVGDDQWPPHRRAARDHRGGLLIIFSMWWLYFDRPPDRYLSSARTAFFWGYGHLPIFASAAAVGAGLAVAVDGAVGRSELDPSATGAAVAIPVAVFILSMSLLYARAHDASVRRLAMPVVVAVLALAASLSPSPVLVVGLLVSGLVALKVGLRLRSDREEPGELPPG